MTTKTKPKISELELVRLSKETYEAQQQFGGRSALYDAVGDLMRRNGITDDEVLAAASFLARIPRGKQ